MILLNGKVIAQKISHSLKNRVKNLDFFPKMTIIQVGDHPASNKYISYKLKQAQNLNIVANLIKVSQDIKETLLINLIQNAAKECDGLIIQLPLPTNFNQQKILNSVPFEKDIDGLRQGNKLMIPATPQAIINLLDAYHFPIKNQIVAVIGQSNLVGKPTSVLCEHLGAKQVLRFDQNTSLSQVKLADIVIVAIGKPKFIKAEHLKQGAVVVDVGINEIADANAMKKIVGDVDQENVKNYVKALSPVPGGVGPMTIVALLNNLVSKCENQKNSKNEE